MENIIEKLNKLENNKSWNGWSLQEQKQLLDIYFTICKKEEYIFKLIYSFHGCDSWEDIFRDYDIGYLNDKADGVEVAINEMINLLKNK